MSWLNAIWDWYSAQIVVNGVIVYPHASLVNPIAAGVGAALLIGAAIQQARVATRRHRAQTVADQQRRITESLPELLNNWAAIKLKFAWAGFTRSSASPVKVLVITGQ
jgi:hypothetical protein